MSIIRQTSFFSNTAGSGSGQEEYMLLGGQAYHNADSL